MPAKETEAARVRRWRQRRTERMARMEAALREIAGKVEGKTGEVAMAIHAVAVAALRKGEG